MSTALRPDQTVATGDPGDETGRRYRYQWTYAAILCCMLFDDVEQVLEVFCEHHEDVLVKSRSGAFKGVQIKTRDLSLPAWKTSDEAVQRSCIRFCRLERQFPGQFSDYRFLTNHPLHTSGNGKDLRYVLEQVRVANGSGSMPTPVTRFLSTIARLSSCDGDIVRAALGKTTADDSLPKLADVQMRLINALTSTWLRATELNVQAVQKAAQYLSDECGRASSLAHEDVLPAYLPASADPFAAEMRARLEGKRFDRKKVQSVLESGLVDSAPLSGHPGALVRPGGGSSELLDKKLDAGGFSAVSRNSAVDLRDKADYLGLVWTQKFGHEPGLQRYSHVRSLVLSDAARAFESARDRQEPFGIAMLDELRARLQQRRAQGGQLYECSNEHLEGFAYSLTSECKVQWSIDRPWEDE